MKIDRLQQRRVATYTFFAIQLIKLAQTMNASPTIYQLLSLNTVPTPLRLNHVLLWSLVDVIFVILLRKYTQPRIKLVGILVFVISMGALNGGFIAMLAGRGEDPIVVVDSGVLKGDYLGGSHTVHVRPPLVAKINSLKESFCVIDRVIVPITVKGVPPFRIRYSIGGVEEGERELNLSDMVVKSSIGYVSGNSTKKGRVGVYGIDVQRVGSVRILTLLDSNGDEAKILGEGVDVVNCPRMSLDPSDVTDVCIGDSVTQKLTVEGQGSLNLVYSIDGNMITKQAESGIIFIEYSIETAGEVKLDLVSIQDSSNNTVQYGDRGLVGHIVGNEVVSISGRSKPIIMFQDCSSLQAIKGESVNVKVSIEGQGPFAVEYQDSDGLHSISIDGNQGNIAAKGVVTLLSIKDEFCLGVVSKASSTCEVRIRPEPSFTFTPPPIEEPCSANEGVKVSFSGDQPFFIEYTVDSMGSVRKEREVFYTNSAVLKVSEGVYKFERVGDRYYTKGVQIDANLTLKPHSHAAFEVSRVRACKGEEINLKVKVRGSGRLTYEVDKKKFETDVKNDLTIKVKGSLVSLVDLNGCKLDSKVVIDVVNSPSIAFKSQKILLLQGQSISLPVTMTGSGPFEVGLERDGKAENARIQGNALVVTQTGHYHITSIRDSVCPGTVFDADMDVIQVPKPVITVPNIIDTCMGAESYARLELDGKAPYTVKIDSKVIKVDAKFTQFKLDTSKVGSFSYHIDGIADDNYKSLLPLDLLLNQRVYPIPSGSFVQPLKCSLDTLRVQLRGTPPFNLTFDTNTVLVTKDQLNKTGDGYLYAPAMPHSNHISLLSVKDATGCQIDYQDESVKVIDQAKITPLNEPLVCIGDLLSYTLQGSPPFTIVYNWNNINQSIIVTDPLLTFWPSTHGNLMITRVCNSLLCCVDVEIPTIVHPLPRATMDHGDDIIDDIKEGDSSTILVDLEGEPPFTFTYTRERLGMKEETVTVEDWAEKRWELETSEEGTFRVSYVKDNVCSYPRRGASRQGVNRFLD